jgi:hypothetical protein
LCKFHLNIDHPSALGLETGSFLSDLPTNISGKFLISHTYWPIYIYRVFENRVLRRVFGPKRDEVTGEWRKLHNEELNDLYF